MSLPIQLSAHALKQMERRGITRDYLTRLFKIGHESPDPKAPPAERVFHLDGPVTRLGREVRVVFKKRPKDRFVITAMFLD